MLDMGMDAHMAHQWRLAPEIEPRLGNDQHEARRDDPAVASQPHFKATVERGSWGYAAQAKGAKWPLRMPLASSQSIPKACMLLRVDLASAILGFTGWHVFSR